MNEIAPRQGADSAPICIDCAQEIGDAHWFCRLPPKQSAAANGDISPRLICTPRCALRHFESWRPAPNGYEVAATLAEHSLHMLIGPERTLFA